MSMTTFKASSTNIVTVINWYPRYESQNWYPNTFLVNTPSEIAQSAGEWNNITDSGCHLTCVAMMLGLNPAYWAALLRQGADDNQGDSRKILRQDPGLPAINLNGQATHLVWDQNAPAHSGRCSTIHIECLWHPTYRAYYALQLRLVRIEEAMCASDAEQLIAMANEEELHVICGYSDHSRLVAGTRDGAFFLWDPDPAGNTPVGIRWKTDEDDLIDMLNGEYDLTWFFEAYEGEDELGRDELATFWSYDAQWAKLSDDDELEDRFEQAQRPGC